MSDLFEACEGEPSEVTAGDLWTWRKDDLAGVYDPADHALAYTITPEAGGAPAALGTVTADGEGWLVTVTAAASAAIAAGRYQLVGRLTRTADAATAVAFSGVLTVKPDPATSEADTRTAARRTLDAIEARIEGRVTKDAESYTIEGRSITRIPITELHKLAGHYRRIVAAEEGRPAFHVRQVQFR